MLLIDLTSGKQSCMLVFTRLSYQPTAERYRMTVGVFRKNRYNSKANEPFYLDREGKPTVDRLGELLFEGNWREALDFTNALEAQDDFDYEIVEKGTK